MMQGPLTSWIVPMLKLPELTFRRWIWGPKRNVMTYRGLWVGRVSCQTVREMVCVWMKESQLRWAIVMTIRYNCRYDLCYHFQNILSISKLHQLLIVRLLEVIKWLLLLNRMSILYVLYQLYSYFIFLRYIPHFLKVVFISGTSFCNFIDPTINQLYQY